ncbi:MAG: DedA family protein [Sulfobacillus sp.]
MHLLNGITQAILGLGVFGVLIGMFLESAYIPVPSEIILPYAGYLVFRHQATLTSAMAAALVGGLLGAIVSYWIARWGGRALVERYGRYIFIRAHELNRAEQWFMRHGDGAVFFGRLLPGIRTFISLPAGVAEMPFGRFIVFTFLGALPWTVLFVYVGYALGQHWQNVTALSHYFLALVLLAVIVWAIWLRNRRKKRA